MAGLPSYARASVLLGGACPLGRTALEPLICVTSRYCGFRLGLVWDLQKEREVARFSDMNRLAMSESYVVVSRDYDVMEDLSTSPLACYVIESEGTLSLVAKRDVTELVVCGVCD